MRISNPQQRENPFLAIIKSNIKFETTPVVSYPEKMRITAVKLSGKYQQQALRPAVDILGLHKRICKAYPIKHRLSLESKEVKTLPNVLYANFGASLPVILNKKEFTSYVLSYLDAENPRHLSRLIFQFLKNYRQETAGHEIVRNFIEEALINAKPSVLRKWQENSIFFDYKCLDMIQKKLGEYDFDINRMLTLMGFSEQLLNGNFARELIKYIYSNKTISYDTKLDLLEKLFIKINRDGSKRILFQETMPCVADCMLDTFYDQHEESQCRVLRSFFIKAMGDPRIDGFGFTWWSQVKPLTRDNFRQLLAQLDLDFFFDIVDLSNSDNNWRYRRKFWEAYLSFIEETWVVLGTEGRTYVNKHASKYNDNYMQYGNLEGASYRQSAFIFKIGKYYFVEWSDSGKLRVFDANKSSLATGKKWYRSYELKDDDCVADFIHSGAVAYSWQKKVADWLLTNINLRLTQSYKI